MKHMFPRLASAVFGLMLYALGIVVTIKANIGYSPWTVFNVGVSKTFGVSIGMASVIIGFTVVIIVILLKEKIGLGTLLNMALIGVFLDLILFIDLIKTPEIVFLRYPMIILGLFIISVATFFYVRAGYGAGPRDSLMVALTRRIKFPVGICRSMLELTVTVIGWSLGGMVGIGTIISVVAMGFCIQITFKLFRFNITSVKHESLYDTFSALNRKKKPL